MTDYNLAQLDLQVNHNSKKVTQMKVLQMDCKDLSRIIRPLKDIQSDTSKILKLYHQYLSEPRKSSGLPYHMIKKFEQLKKSLATATYLLEVQSRLFKNQISNRDFSKANEQQFFKKTLLSYDQKRLWMKNYILNNEKRVQKVEEEVLKNMQYCQHRYTQFLNTIDLERIQHNYHPKLDLMTSVCRAIKKNCQLRSKIKQKLHQQKNFVQKEKLSQEDLTNELKQLKNAFTITSLFYNIQSRLDLKQKFLLNSKKSILKTKFRVIAKNKALKVAIDKMNQIIDQNALEAMIVMDQLQDEKQKRNDINKIKEKITKTDYLIYLKEIHCQAQQRIKNYGQYFQYSLVQSNQFHNIGKSKSVMKPYPIRVIPEIGRQDKKEICIQDFLDKNQKNRIKMMQQRSQTMVKMKQDIDLEQEIKEMQKETIFLEEEQLQIGQPCKRAEQE